MSCEPVSAPFAVAPVTPRSLAAPRADASLKPAVVLLHSSLSSKQQWNRLVRTLAPDFRVITVDLYGYGERRMPASHADFSLDTEIGAVMERIDDEIGDEAFHLVGHSYGGAIALRLAAANATRIRSLSVYEPVAFGLLEDGDQGRYELTRLTEAMQRAMEFDRTEATRLFIDYWNGPGAFGRLPEDVKSDFIDRIPKVPLDFQALFGDTLQLSEVAAFDFPVCLMAGLRSPASTLRIIENLTLALPRAECHFIDAGHMAPLTHADTVNPVLADFIAYSSLARPQFACFAHDDAGSLFWPK